MRWFPARTARTTVMIDVDRVGILSFQSTLCIIAERLSARQIIPRRISEIVVCIYNT